MFVKYRVWNRESKNWASHLAAHDDQYKSPERGLYVPSNCVMQLFTGIKDKNNKDIFEGDIVLVKEALFLVNYFKGFYEGEIVTGFNIPAENEVTEVIGNIFENPELLKKIEIPF